MSDNVVNVTDDSFAVDVLQSDLPVLVDFWAPWCGPCRMLAPTLEKIAQEFVGKIKVAKVNVDENGQTANTYGIRGIPTMILFKGGKIITTQTGLLAQPQLSDLIKSNI